ncbi:hypothetical protein GCM10025868_14580 [Angustibacter aerolatus]|uniref:Uncharacterized protein n=1 Tax=Angustibacter aerolatus TaxID=1162965 RepID=A0ABQ6JFK1_9ACTN|nr:hypothetical protein GCM10025868_14580 [Angustibacter aerolatus]
MAADLWSWTGVPGLLVAALMVGVVLWSLVTLLAARRAAALAVFLAVSGLWNIAFSPIASSLGDVMLSLAVLWVMTPARVDGAAPATPGARAAAAHALRVGAGRTAGRPGRRGRRGGPGGRRVPA